MEVALLGERFSFTANSESDEYLSSLLAHFQQLIDSVKHDAGPQRDCTIAILAGLRAVDEYFKHLAKSNAAQGTEAILPAHNAHNTHNTHGTHNTHNTETPVQDAEEASDIANSILSKLDEII